MSFSLNLVAEKKNVAKAVVLLEAQPLNNDEEQTELVNAAKAAVNGLANGFPNGTVLSVSISGHAAPRAEPQQANTISVSVYEVPRPIQ